MNEKDSDFDFDIDEYEPVDERLGMAIIVTTAAITLGFFVWAFVNLLF